MAYRPTFDCLWCGVTWATRGPNDLEGWAQLCPDCLGRAGSNPFLRGRLRAALAQRVSVEQASAAAAAAAHHAAVAHHAVPGPSPARSPAPSPGAVSRPTPYPAFPDDWFLRRGEFQRGAIHDAAWAAELDMVTRWLDGLPLAGRIVEPAAGVGFFSPLLADRGELFAFDADGQALDRARDRLLAHNLRAHLHEADPWAAALAAEPSAAIGATGGLSDGGLADVVVAAFLVGRVRGAGLDNAAASLRARLRSGGLLALVELHPDAAGGPPPGVAWTWHEPALLEAALRRAGFLDLRVTGTGRFFLTASAVAR
ncbi:MAG: Class SAM-dependent methyltransferase [Chloroflexota bacterium]|nr:Class SAM-dependent methyltransferase [Chloroflexota bacterium]